MIEVAGGARDANQLKLKLVSDFKLNPQSMLYNLVVSKYKVLTPFSKRHSEVEFFWDKKNKNALLNKFYAKAKIEKDTITVADLLISTAIVPYKVHVFLPAVLGKLRPGWTQIDIDVAHTPGTSLEMKVNHPGAQFTGFKIAKTGYGNEREVEWNGEKLGNYVLCLSRRTFKMTTTLANGESYTTFITWGGRSYLNNGFVVEVQENPVNSITINLSWRIDKLPDFDLSTPEDGVINLSALVMSTKRDDEDEEDEEEDEDIFVKLPTTDYQIQSRVQLSSAARKISLDMTGEYFNALNIYTIGKQDTIETEVKLTFDVDKADLIGKLKKVMAGKEYSIEFQPGLAMPIIKLGA